jgi:hypothetical protein
MPRFAQRLGRPVGVDLDAARATCEPPVRIQPRAGGAEAETEGKWV